jgi:hypothetical protein
MKIIALVGLKNAGRVILARKWDKNANVSYIEPILNPTDRNGEYLASTVVNGDTYVFYESQLKNDFNVLVADDYILSDLLTNYPDVVSVWVDNPRAEPSERVNVMYTKNDFDYTYNYGLDDPDEWLEQLAFDLEMVQNG